MQWQGLVLVLMGAFLYALYETINKKLLKARAPDECIATANFLGGGALLMLASLLFQPPIIESVWSWHGGLMWPLLATSLLNIVILFGNVKALKYGDVSLIGPVSATQPMIVIIPSYLILGEQPGTLGWFGLLLLAIGMYAFAFGHYVYLKQGDEKIVWTPPRYLSFLGGFAKYAAPWALFFRNRGVQIAFLVAIAGSIAINFDKLTTVYAHSFLFPPAFILLFCGVVGLEKTIRGGQWAGVSRVHLPHLIGNPIVLALVLVCYWTAFHFGLAMYVGALKRTTVLFALLLGYFVLGEKGAKNRWGGGLIMMVGAALVSLDQ